MIASLQGKLLEVNPPAIVIDVNGVGYLAQASMSTIYELPQVTHSVFLYTHMVVREDAQLLYAFSNPQERVLFQALIKINGVGPKVALAILSHASISDLCEWVAEKAVIRFKKIPGVGPKTAERILLDLKDKLPKLNLQSSASQVVMVRPTKLIEEAEQALFALGYKPKEIEKVMQTADPVADDLSVQDIIKHALKRLAM